MKLLRKDNVWNIFVIVNISLCLISSLVLSKIGSTSRFNSLLVTILVFALAFKIINIKDNYYEKRR